MDDQTRYRALATKDRRFDGKIFFGVQTTGIYCRPVCPARLPAFRNVRFFLSAAAAEDSGFRACLRCRPESSPGTPAWVGTSATVSRALRLIAGGCDDISSLSDKLGVSDRHLRRLFLQHLGAPPHAIASVRRLDFARQLLDQTSLPATQVAFACGFRSIRRFNDAFRLRFRGSPTKLRRQGRSAIGPRTPFHLRLAYRPPFAWHEFLAFLRVRAIPGVEECGADFYSRTIALPKGPGRFFVRPAAGAGALELTVEGAQSEDLLGIVQRVRALFDLDADSMAIDAALSRSERLRRAVRATPGLRVPGTWDGFELAVRAFLGQQVSVAGARTMAGRLAQRFGKPTGTQDRLSHLFPTPDALAEADVASIGLPSKRAEAIRQFAAVVTREKLSLDPSVDSEQVRERLLALPGVGPWTAEYIALRALRDPNAFPSGDLILRRRLNGADPDEWAPWKAYATMHLWRNE